ncbi:hypothetical protein [Ensifer sp. YR511]|uniref:hypothetical protein n=1 Tax=Ensifer sp. YR511 TaxID=1855294 RepID=UPI000AFA80F9|nr:hypothetical protein [Ensifer sp. YR511]
MGHHRFHFGLDRQSKFPKRNYVKNISVDTVESFQKYPDLGGIHADCYRIGICSGSRALSAATISASLGIAFFLERARDLSNRSFERRPERGVRSIGTGDCLALDCLADGATAVRH